MKCKFCRRDIPENSVFCNWCGKKQLKGKTEISVPAPRWLKSGAWFAQLMVKGQRVPISGKTGRSISGLFSVSRPISEGGRHRGSYLLLYSAISSVSCAKNA